MTQRPGAPTTRTRLDAIAALVPPVSRVADVGTDHARLALALLADGRASFCLASDVRAEAVRLARRVARHAGGRLVVRRGAGLAPIRRADRIEVIVLAGLGARTIASILADPRLGTLRPARLVLQPQTEPGGLRRWLTARGWCTVAETIAREHGRYYVVLAAERGGSPRTFPELSAEESLEAGPCLVASGDPLVREYWELELRRLDRLCARVGAGAARERLAGRRQLARRVLRTLEGVAERAWYTPARRPPEVSS